jgi:hypothetical protein
MAQQEVSPDYFDATSVLDQQVSRTSAKARDERVAVNRAPKKGARSTASMHSNYIVEKRVELEVFEKML